MSHTVLAIDDESRNLMLIGAYLEGEGYDIEYFSGAAPALAYLRSDAPADVVLLDRMMPGFDGMAFMREFRSLPRFDRVPVIMQTAAAFPAQVAEGIAAGAYYYLTKPYSRQMLTVVLARAIADHAFHRQQEAAAARRGVVDGRIESVTLGFRTLGEVRDIASFLASLYPTPTAAILGIRELMLNAVEHGNLGISYEEKTALVREATWEREIERRLALPEHAGKVAEVRLDRDGSRTILTVTDRGAGFDCARYLDFEPGRARDPHGRGIAMSRLISFDRVEYGLGGTRVICTKAGTNAGSGPPPPPSALGDPALSEPALSEPAVTTAK
jgi:CheY-like chemotaxis protein